MSVFLYLDSMKVVVLLLALSGAVHAGINCSNDTVCIKTQNSSKGITLSVLIKRRAPITVDLSIKTKNAQVRWLNKASETYNKSGEYPLAVITPVNSSKGWNYNYRYYYQRGSLYAKHDRSYVYLLPVKPSCPLESRRVLEGNLVTRHMITLLSTSMSLPTPILAARAGRVVAVKEDSNKGGPYLKFAKDGNYVAVLHDDQTIASYFHLNKTVPL